MINTKFRTLTMGQDVTKLEERVETHVYAFFHSVSLEEPIASKVILCRFICDNKTGPLNKFVKFH